MSSIKLLSARYGERGVIRRYQHRTLRPLDFVTLWGASGNADTINITDLRWAVYEQKERAAGREPYALKIPAHGPKRRARARHRAPGLLPLPLNESGNTRSFGRSLADDDERRPHAGMRLGGQALLDQLAHGDAHGLGAADLRVCP